MADIQKFIEQSFFVRFNHRYLIEVDCSKGQFKPSILKDKEYTISAPSFYTTLQQKKEIETPINQHLLADGQLLIADAVSSSIKKWVDKIALLGFSAKTTLLRIA